MDCIYLRVESTIPAFHLIGHMEGNEWIGASRCLWPIYVETTLNPGDEIHELPGGVFGVTREGEILTCLKAGARPEVQSVMLHWGRSREVKPSKAGLALTEIPANRARIPASYQRATPLATVRDKDGWRMTIPISDDPSSVGRLVRPECLEELINQGGASVRAKGPRG